MPGKSCTTEPHSQSSVFILISSFPQQKQTILRMREGPKPILYGSSDSLKSKQDRELSHWTCSLAASSARPHATEAEAPLSTLRVRFTGGFTLAVPWSSRSALPRPCVQIPAGKINKVHRSLLPGHKLALALHTGTVSDLIYAVCEIYSLII